MLGKLTEKALFVEQGYGQVEPNHLSAQRTGQIYAQLPTNTAIKVLENGQFVKYDYANNEVNFTGAGEWMLVMNEVKLYDDFWRESYKDFALVKDNYNNGVMAPRVFKTMPGDIYTTNCLEKGNTSGKATVTGTEEIEVGTELKINAQGFLSINGTSDIVFQVVKVYTMPDGQQGVKVMRIK
jgi:hypothetical protein